MASPMTFQRYETKFLLTEEQRLALLPLLKNRTCPDHFGSSTIFNVYYDTPSGLLARRSSEKPLFKEKLRLRSYGVATPTQEVFVELKRKYDGIVYKRRVAMPEQFARHWLKSGQPVPENAQIVREISYFLSCYPDIAPAIHLSYDREALLCLHDPNLRLTFDTNILWRTWDLTLGQGAYGQPLLPETHCLLEVKSRGGIPLWLVEFLNKNHSYKTSFSKYANAWLLQSQAKEKGGNQSA